MAQAPFQRTALQLVHRHDHVELIHGCVMTRACSRQSRVVYGKLFWAGQASQLFLPVKVASAATVVRPDALPCPSFFGSSVVPPPKLERVSKLLCLPLVEANVP